MGSRVALAWLFTGGILALAQGPGDVIGRVRAAMRQNLARIPDYVCLQTVSRSHRAGEKDAFRPRDLLRVEVGVSGNRELYAWPDAGRFGEQELAAMVGSGVVGTGNYALFAKHIFAAEVAEFTPRGEEIRGGRRTLRFDYDVPRELSAYRLRVPPHAVIVGFHGSFWVDAASLDLVRLEVRADDIPASVGMALAATSVNYERVTVGSGAFLLPVRSELLMVTALGDQSLNRSEFSACRQYQAAAHVSFDANEADRVASGPAAAQPAAQSASLPRHALLEIALAADIDPETAAAGDSIQGILAKPVKDGERIIAPEGSAATGRVLGVEKRSSPVEHYIVALQFHTLEWDGNRAPFTATMEDAGPAPGLIRQERRMNPTFSRGRTARLQILVDEQHPGQGMLHWDARKPRIPKGLKTRWRVDPREQP